LISNFSSGIENEVPPGEQAIVQLVERHEFVQPGPKCPTSDTQRLLTYTYVVLPDLSSLAPGYRHPQLTIYSG
jgi:hypothetical protein